MGHALWWGGPGADVLCKEWRWGPCVVALYPVTTLKRRVAVNVGALLQWRLEYAALRGPIMFTSLSKIKKAKGASPDRLEENVAQAIYELQVNSDKLKGPLREVHITAAKEVDVGGGKQCIVVFVPVPMLGQFQKVIKERSLIEELEKKFAGQSIIVIAERRILRKESRNTRQLKQLRPRSRTLTAVHESILDDLVFPTEIVGKRTRVRQDGSKLLKVHLHHENKPNGDRLDTFSRVYKNLTGKDIVFEFPASH